MCVKAISPSFALWQEKSDVYTLKIRHSRSCSGSIHNLLGRVRHTRHSDLPLIAGRYSLLDRVGGAPKGAGSVLVFFRRWRWRIKFKQFIPKAVFLDLKHFGQFTGDESHGLLLQAAFTKRKLLGAADKQKFA